MGLKGMFREAFNCVQLSSTEKVRIFGVLKNS